MTIVARIQAEATWAPVMAPIVAAVERYGWLRVETATHAWAGQIRRGEVGCPDLVSAWRRSLADTVLDAIALRGIEGLEELATRVVCGVEDAAPGAGPLDLRVARWSRLVYALDRQSGARSSFPLPVLAASDLDAIVALVEEREEARRLHAEERGVRVA
ncbi:hypothetical protein [Microbacterium sp. ZOR0019]|uniref:hypothetical protein n=1 Tax=Microbacterium sp. ZOR0019 TaxID=1339233 RepID=UPI00064841A8|nr:hypothetical protein [Microbacterium sp. ZOR0019]